MKVLLRGQTFVLVTVAYKNSTGLNSCAMKQGQSDLKFPCRTVLITFSNCPRYHIEMNQYPLRGHVDQIVYCPYNVPPMRTLAGVRPCLTSSQHVPYCVPKLRIMLE